MLVFLIILFLFIGSIGGFVVNSSINTWYTFLNKPSFNPPSFIFGPVWTILYILLAVFYWRLGKIITPENMVVIKNIKNIFILQLILNFMWTPVFFGLKSILGGLIMLILLDLLVFYITWMCFKVDKICFYISLIYLLWLLYATSLNLSLLILN